MSVLRPPHRGSSRAVIGAAVLAVAGFVVAVPGSAVAFTTMRLAPGPIPGPPLDDPTVVDPGQLPSTPAPGCTFAPLRSTEVRSLFNEVEGGAAGSAAPPSVDSGNPCLMYRAASDGSIQRGIYDGHATRWTTVLHPQTLTGPGHTDLVTVVPSGQAYAQGRSGYDAVVHTADGGWHWDRRDTGLLGAGGAYGRDSPHPGALLAFAPSDPRVGLVWFEGDGLVHHTTDGGRSWSLLAIPAARPGVLAFDPLDAAHMYVIDNTVMPPQPRPPVPTLYESHDGGATWATTAIVGFGGPVTDLVVTHAAGGPVRLLAAVQVLQSSVTLWYVSGGAGQSWNALPIAPEPYSALAADPGDPQTMVWIGATDTEIRIAASRDGFTTAPTAVVRSALPAGLVPDSNDGPPVMVEPDLRGDFIVYRALWSPSMHISPQQRSLVAFRPSAILGLSSALKPQSSQPPPPPPPPALSREERTCAMSLLPPYSGNSGISSGAGSVTFDGRYLDYTGDSSVPGIIFRIDGSCRPAPPLVLRASDFAQIQVPALYELTYDAEFVFPDGTFGAILATGAYQSDPRVPAGDTPIYAINPISGAALLVAHAETGVCGAAGPTDPSCHNNWGDADPLFSYDIFRHQIWSIGRAADGSIEPGPMGFDGVVASTCMGPFANPFTGFGASSPQANVATWTVGGDGGLYVQLEDDMSVYRVDARTCRVLDGFRHRRFSEAGNEDEQLACDPLTFSRDGGRGGESVVWIRDSAPNTVSAYSVPTGYCPFPTDLTYTGATRTAVSAPVQLCAVLRAMTAGTRDPLGGQTVAFRLGGLAVGSGQTDGNGRACVRAIAPAFAGMYPIRADFAGTNAYLPSHTTATLLAVAGTVSLSAAPPAAGLVAATALPPPQAPAADAQMQPQPVAESQLQAQAETQAQVQSQSVAQAQPGVMTQPQRQRRVATQVAPTRQAQGALLASAARVQQVMAPAVLLLVAGGLLRLRPRRAPAWCRRSPDVTPRRAQR